MEAYSPDTGRTYENWQALLDAETTGYVVVGTTTRPNTRPVVVGPFATEEEGKRAQARLRRKWNKEEAEVGHKASALLRNLWSPEPIFNEVRKITPATRVDATQVVCDMLGAADFEGMEVCDFADAVVARLLASGHVRLP
jgi:hypothetical protein